MTNLVGRDVGLAADAIRAANHSTMRGALDGPESYDVVGSLVELVQRLPQVLDFVSRSLRRADPAEYFDDRGSPSEQALCLAHGHLDDTRHHGVEMAAQLAVAHNHLGHLGLVLPED